MIYCSDVSWDLLVPPVESHALVYDVFPHLEEVVELPEYAGVISAVLPPWRLSRREPITSLPLCSRGEC